MILEMQRAGILLVVRRVAQKPVLESEKKDPNAPNNDFAQVEGSRPSTVVG